MLLCWLRSLAAALQFEIYWVYFYYNSYCSYYSNISKSRKITAIPIMTTNFIHLFIRSIR
ncbi:hypothetical protein C5469_18930 [Photorhabdus cinerea]|uniref:Uncharacterized protein n=1 Tax=Photorhabdus cinerea TaxID=471575 RepID=A0A7X5QGS9_9GAMM|nr:hypothetical protein [Photorhabdus cinerea]